MSNVHKGMTMTCIFVMFATQVFVDVVCASYVLLVHCCVCENYSVQFVPFIFECALTMFLTPIYLLYVLVSTHGSPSS